MNHYVKEEKMSLQFGSITFTDPVKLTQWNPASGPGIYCICVANHKWSPVPLQPIFFAASKDLADQELLREQVALESWRTQVSSSNKLLVAHVHLPEFSADQLGLFEQQLIAQYQPPCNRWDPLPAMSLPAQRRSGVLAPKDPLPVMQSEMEKLYA